VTNTQQTTVRTCTKRTSSLANSGYVPCTVVQIGRCTEVNAGGHDMLFSPLLWDWPADVTHLQVVSTIVSSYPVTQTYTTVRRPLMTLSYKNRWADRA